MSAPKCGLTETDLVMVLDSSTSVTAQNFEKMKQFVKDLLKEADVDRGSTQVGIVTYSTGVYIQFHLNKYHSLSAMLRAVDEIPYRYGSTNTADSLKVLRSQMFTSHNGDRPNVRNVAIIVTDGVSNINGRRTVPEAEMVRSAGIYVYAIGIGLADETELRELPSHPVSENTYTVQDFDELQGLEQKIFTSACLGGIY